MARRKLPHAVAITTGAAAKNPARYRQKALKRIASGLGSPPSYLSPPEIEAWCAFQVEMPWLTASDRTLVAIASKLRARMVADPEMGVKAMTQLRLCLSAMGGTPADRQKVASSGDGEGDPVDEFLN